MRRDRLRPKCGHAGALLLDLLVVSGVAALALVTTAASVLAAQRETQRNTQVRAATPILASLLEEVRGAPFATFDATYAAQTRNVSGMPGAGLGATATFAVADVPTGSARWQVRRVTVTIRWNGPGGPCQVSGVTFASDRGSGTSGVGGGHTP